MQPAVRKYPQEKKKILSLTLLSFGHSLLAKGYKLRMARTTSSSLKGLKLTIFLKTCIHLY